MPDGTRTALYLSDHRGPGQRDLRDIMDDSHVIRVYADGSVSDVTPVDGRHGAYAPEAIIELDADGQIMPAGNFDDGTPGYPGSYAGLAALAESQGWDLMTSPDGTPLWDNAYFVGGDLADEILSRPGLYTRVQVSALGPDEELDREDSPGFVIACRPEPVMCVTCGGELDREDPAAQWYHADSLTPDHSPVYMTPAYA